MLSLERVFGIWFLALFIVIAVTAIAVETEVQDTSRRNQSSKLVVETNKVSPSGRLKSHRVNRKRCRYSEREIDEINKRNLKMQASSDYYNMRESGDDSNVEKRRFESQSLKNQPKIREQYYTRFGDSCNLLI